MKKLFFALLLALMFCACNSVSSCESENCDSASVDSVLVDSVAVEADTLVQCKAITKAGEQCKRLCDKGDTLCFQHKK